MAYQLDVTELSWSSLVEETNERRKELKELAKAAVPDETAINADKAAFITADVEVANAVYKTSGGATASKPESKAAVAEETERLKAEKSLETQQLKNVMWTQLWHYSVVMWTRLWHYRVVMWTRLWHYRVVMWTQMWRYRVVMWTQLWHYLLELTHSSKVIIEATFFLLCSRLGESEVVRRLQSSLLSKFEPKKKLNHQKKNRM